MNKIHPHTGDHPDSPNGDATSVVSRLHPLQHYIWGDQCDGWNFVDQPGLSVKMERMPPHTAEQLHFHQEARQFFFILEGAATFEIEEGPLRVNEQQGIEIPPGNRHRIRNDEDSDLIFLLCSQPSTAGDRTNV
jgi:mannose-6-phosphate isomerase-like protein (cupin superfamily)